jgi:hypothetical protein
VDLFGVTLVLAGLALLLLVFSLRRLWQARIWSAGSAACLGLASAALAALLFGIASNLRTYQRLTHERRVAELVFQAQGPQRYTATLTRVPGGDAHVFVLAGDEWQLDARLLKWRGWANVLGLDARYRLERMSGRYRDLEQERRSAHTVYALAENPGVDLWALALEHPRWLPFVDAVYGSAVYLPMADGARFRVSVGQSGLLARPTNAAAEAAVGQWR